MVLLHTPLKQVDIEKLKVGDRVALDGIVYTARDKAHERMAYFLRTGKKLPFNPKGQVIFYAGPAPAKPGRTIGSVGPTTSSRMDTFTPLLLEQGLKGMIGKGDRSERVKEAIREYKAVYFVATGGAAALLSQYVVQAGVYAFEDLGPEAIYRLEVKDFPVIVAIDSSGRDLFQEALQEFKRSS